MAHGFKGPDVHHEASSCVRLWESGMGKAILPSIELLAPASARRGQQLSQTSSFPDYCFGFVTIIQCKVTHCLTPTPFFTDSFLKQSTVPWPEVPRKLAVLEMHIPGLHPNWRSPCLCKRFKTSFLELRVLDEPESCCSGCWVHLSPSENPLRCVTSASRRPSNS